MHLLIAGLLTFQFLILVVIKKYRWSEGLHSRSYREKYSGDIENKFLLFAAHLYRARNKTH